MTDFLAVCMWLFILLLICGVHSRGYVETKLCKDQDCCRDCKTEMIDLMEFDGICRWDGEFGQTHHCINGRFYKNAWYDNEWCDGDALYQETSGQCYQDEETGGSFYLICQDGLKGSNADTHKSTKKVHVYFIGALVSSIVFLCGVLGGFFVYKRGYRKANEIELDAMDHKMHLFH